MLATGRPGEIFAGDIFRMTGSQRSLLRPFWRRSWSVKHDNIADASHQVAAARLRQLRGKFFFLVLEVIKFHFDQFVLPKGIVQSGEELWANAVFADLECRLQSLGLGFESSYLRISERNHSSRI